MCSLITFNSTLEHGDKVNGLSSTRCLMFGPVLQQIRRFTLCRTRQILLEKLSFSDGVVALKDSCQLLFLAEGGTYKYFTCGCFRKKKQDKRVGVFVSLWRWRRREQWWCDVVFKQVQRQLSVTVTLTSSSHCHFIKSVFSFYTGFQLLIWFLDVFDL